MDLEWASVGTPVDQTDSVIVVTEFRLVAKGLMVSQSSKLQIWLVKTVTRG